MPRLGFLSQRRAEWRVCARGLGHGHEVPGLGWLLTSDLAEAAPRVAPGTGRSSQGRSPSLRSFTNTRIWLAVTRHNSGPEQTPRSVAGPRVIGDDATV